MAEPTKPARRLTQYDVAHEASVSQTTVSQVLRNPEAPNIPEETRQRVLDAVRVLGYVPDRVARSLRTGKTHIIAAVIPDITNPFYPAMVRGIQDVAEAHEYNVATYNTDGDAGKEARILDVVLQARVDGMILAPFQIADAHLTRLAAQGLPVVLFADRNDFAKHDFDTVGSDARSSAAMAAEYLLGRGHRRMAVLTSKLAAAGVARAEGFEQAIAGNGRPPGEAQVLWCKDFTEASGYAGMQQAARLQPLPTAIFAASDQLALGALQAARELGIRVPQDVALMGVDDIYSARLVSPALTTIAQDQDQQGRTAAQFLLDRIEGRYSGPARRHAIPFRLVVRESA